MSSSSSMQLLATPESPEFSKLMGRWLVSHASTSGTVAPASTAATCCCEGTAAEAALGNESSEPCVWRLAAAFDLVSRPSRRPSTRNALPVLLPWPLAADPSPHGEYRSKAITQDADLTGRGGCCGRTGDVCCPVGTGDCGCPVGTGRGDGGSGGTAAVGGAMLPLLLATGACASDRNAGECN